MRSLYLVGKGTTLSLRYGDYDGECADNNDIMWIIVVLRGIRWL